MNRKKFIEAVRALIAAAGDEEALKAKEFYPDWQAGKALVAGNRVQYNGKLYTILQSHYSQPDWTPDVASSLFAEVLIPDPGEIPDWVQPGSTNAYKKGDKVKHNGKIWVSLIDNNVWEPGAPGTESLWQEVAS